MHIFGGMLLIPRLLPSLLDGTGPNTGIYSLLQDEEIRELSDLYYSACSALDTLVRKAGKDLILQLRAVCGAYQRDIL